MDFSSQICSGLLFRAHTSYQSPRVAHWHLSHQGADERSRRSPPFYGANFNTSQKHLWEHCCSPHCELPSALCGPGKSSRSERGCTETGLQMEDFRSSPAGRQTHRTQCSSSVQGAPRTPLTLASCWSTPWHTFPHSSVSVFISDFLSLWDLLTLATNRAALQWGIKKEMGVTVLPPLYP